MTEAATAAAAKRSASFVEPQGKRTRGAAKSKGKAHGKSQAQIEVEVEAEAEPDGVVVPRADIVLLIRAHTAVFTRVYVVSRASVSDEEWKFATSADQFGHERDDDDESDAKVRYFADDYATFKRLVRLMRRAQNTDAGTIKNTSSRLPGTCAYALTGLYVAHEIVLTEMDL